jgi:hypothetical protein
VLTVKGSATNKLTFETMDPVLEAGDRYAVARGIYPLHVLISAIREALGETFVVAEAVVDPPVPILGDGTTMLFNMPTGSSRVVRVELEDPDDSTNVYESTHYRERNPYLTFAEGYAPQTDWVVHVYTRQDHPELVDASDEISEQIDDEWLRWKATEYALYWGVAAYGDAKEYRIEERMNRVLAKTKGLAARQPLVTTITAG